MQKTCAQTGQAFEISDEDLNFYNKISPVFNGEKFQIPSPTLCPDARLRRRLAWRNERKLYTRKCDKTGSDIISWISPDKPHKVYKKDIWWGDTWNAKDYGRDFDFNRPFFEQIKELIIEVPWLDLLVDNTFNSDYVNFCNNAKDCYLIYASNDNEDCMHSSYIWKSKDCIDCLQGFEMQLCYDSVDLTNCYNCHYSKNCSNSSDLIFCENCQNCRNCFGSVNLVGQEYYFMNQKLNKEEYERKIAEINLGSYMQVEKARDFFAKHRLKFPMQYANIINCHESTGHNIKNCKNAHYAFDVSGAEDSKFLLLGSEPIKDCYDCSGIEGTELCYETVVNGLPSTKSAFSSYIWKGVHNTYYSVLSPATSDSFGCMGLHRGRYCILNKEYSSKEAYEAMVSKIIKHMQNTGEWGEFFPGHLSPFGYKETIANEYFPLNKEEALKQEFNWSDYEVDPPKVAKSIPAAKLPDNIKDTPDEILDWAIECAISGKPFRLLKQELAFYRKHNIPIPRKHPDERHKRRMAKRTAPKLYDRKCAKTGVSLKSPYAPDRPEIIYSKEAYLAEVY